MGPLACLIGILVLVTPLHAGLQFTYPVDDARLRRAPVEVILQDHLGYLWLGTGAGLFQYDAYEITQVLPQPGADSNNPLGDGIRVQALYEDEQNQLWVGTNRGVLVYDSDRQLKHHFQNNPNSTSLSSDEVSEINADAQGSIWIGTGNGLNRFNQESGEMQRFRHSSEDPHSLRANQITGLVQTPSGELWIATASPGSLARFEVNSGNFTPFYQHPDAILCLLAHSDGNLWFGTWGRGLFQLNPQSGALTQHLPSPDDPSSLASEIIVSLMEHTDGSLWIGTFDKGLNRMDLATGEVAWDHFEPGTPGSLPFNSVYSMYQDREGDTWLGLQQEGISRYASREAIFRLLTRKGSHPAPTATTALAENHVEDLWIGTQFQGLTRFTPGDQSYAELTIQNQSQEPFDLTSIRSLMADEDGSLWIGTFRQGFCFWDASTQSLQTFPIRRTPNAQGETVFALTRDRNMNLWIGYERFGIERLNRTTGKRKHFPLYIDSESQKQHDSAWPIFCDSKGRIWFSTHYGGVKRLSENSDTIESLMPPIIDPDQTAAPAVTSFAAAVDGSMWAATSRGLIHWQAGDASPVFIGKQQGLPTERITSIVFSQDNSLWAATDIGIIRYNHQHASTDIFPYGKDLDYIGFNRGVTLAACSGRIYFGGNRGIVYFDPSATQLSSSPPAVRLRGVSVENESWQQLLEPV